MVEPNYYNSSGMFRSVPHVQIDIRPFYMTFRLSGLLPCNQILDFKTLKAVVIIAAIARNHAVVLIRQLPAFMLVIANIERL